MAIEPPAVEAVRMAIGAALLEDRAFEDVTTLSTIPETLNGEATFVARQPAVLAGMGIAAAVFAEVDPRCEFDTLVEEGSRFEAGARLAVVSGPVRALLMAERVALNFVQRLSGVATLTARYVEAVAGTGAVILDTRKTTPGLRALEKYAVRCGGGTNHRADLAAMAMIKDNHRAALSRAELSLADGVGAIRRATPGLQVEVEIDSLEQLEDALRGAPEWILLDNMAPDLVREAVRRCAARARLEASGGVTLETVRALAETGVDAISVGALTHSAPAVDISLDLRF